MASELAGEVVRTLLDSLMDRRGMSAPLEELQADDADAFRQMKEELAGEADAVLSRWEAFAQSFTRGSLAGNRTVARVLAEVERQDAAGPGYAPTRDGIRLGIAAAEDELREALGAWREGRPPKGQEAEAGYWSAAGDEMVQLAAVATRVVRSLISAGVRVGP